MSIAEILSLPVAERILLIEQIWDSLNPEDISITNAQKQEIDYRKELDKQGLMEWNTWLEVKEKIRSGIK